MSAMSEVDVPPDETGKGDPGRPAARTSSCGHERNHWDGSRWRCYQCRAASRRTHQRRYEGTAKGILTQVRYKATLRRG